MRIGIDVDEVLADYRRGLLSFLSQHHQITATKDQCRSYRLSESGLCTPQEEAAILASFDSSPEFGELLPVEGANEGIEALSGHTLHIVTSRRRHLRDATHRWLDRRFGLSAFESIQFTQSPYRPSDDGYTKAETCRRNRIGIMIEDDPLHAQGCADAGINVLLMDVPWNRHYNPGGLVTRVRSWPEIVKYINRQE